MNLTINPNYYQKTSNKNQSKTKNYPLTSFVSKNSLQKDVVSFRGSANSEIINELRNTIAAQDEAMRSLNQLGTVKDETIRLLNQLITAKDECISELVESKNQIESCLLEVKDLCQKNEKMAFTLMKTNDAKDLLNDKFIRPAIKEQFIKDKDDLGDVSSIPTGIAITGSDDKLSDYLTQWATSSSELSYSHIDFKDLDQNEALSKIYWIEKLIRLTRRDNVFTVDPQGNTTYARPLERNIIHIKNFEKFTTPDKKNKAIIDHLNDMLKTTAKNHKYTIIINTKELDNVSPELTSDEHFQLKINLGNASMKF